MRIIEHRQPEAKPIEQLKTDSPTTTEQINYDDIEAIKLQQAILSLPTKQQLTFNLRYYDELSYDQIAAITETTATSAKANYHLAKKRIIEYLQTHDWAMNNRIDIDRIGKRMPYTTPDNFFSELEQNVRHELGGVVDNTSYPNSIHKRHLLMRPIAIKALTTAAAAVLLVICGVLYLQHRDQGYTAIDDAFEQLDPNDQMMIMEGFYDDIFINEP